MSESNRRSTAEDRKARSGPTRGGQSRRVRVGVGLSMPLRRATTIRRESRRRFGPDGRGPSLAHNHLVERCLPRTTGQRARGQPVLVEQFRKLAATLHHAQAGSGIRVIMLTSASPDDGKTLTALNLALVLSESYRRTGVAHRRRPAAAVARQYRGRHRGARAE